MATDLTLDQAGVRWGVLYWSGVRWGVWYWNDCATLL